MQAFCTELTLWLADFISQETTWFHCFVFNQKGDITEDTDATEDQFEKDAKLDHKLKVRNIQKEITHWLYTFLDNQKKYLLPMDYSFNSWTFPFLKKTPE